MTFKRNGKFLLTLPGPADVPELRRRTWTQIGLAQIQVTFEKGIHKPFTLEIISIEPEVLKVRRF